MLVVERWASDVPRRALNTTSSGLGTSNANPRSGGRGLGGRRGTDATLSRSERFELVDLPLTDGSLVRLRSRSALWCWQRKTPSEPFTDAASSSSLTRMVAKAEGTARERIVSGENMGTSSMGASCSGSGSGSVDSFVRAVLLFKASFDGLESDDLREPEVTPVGIGGKGWTGWGPLSWFLDSKPVSDW